MASKCDWLALDTSKACKRAWIYSRNLDYTLSNLGDAYILRLDEANFVLSLFVDFVQELSEVVDLVDIGLFLSLEQIDLIL